ncbi:hypothetical protein [Cochlodiniinecator piscidefendens]|uniref:hypothetical protein n=1 Tax=Cochlodiniinecator piscidefendens TaxID=2715756 RepID=UPI00140940B5|nr:hypothetical protein [Cochlodiniinecator piscidefendens]
MTTVNFDLGAQNSIDLINTRVSDIAKQQQKAFRDAGRGIVVIKNTKTLNTAIDLANTSVMYHGIAAKDVSNCKKFAHLCFWMLKLHPISFVRSSDVAKIALSVFKQAFPADANLVEIPEDALGGIQTHSLNQTAALVAFATLVCDNFYDKQTAEQKVEKFMSSNLFNEVLRSMQFHNYSARTMAMYLESFVQERLL